MKVTAANAKYNDTNKCFLRESSQYYVQRTSTEFLLLLICNVKCS